MCTRFDSAEEIERLFQDYPVKETARFLLKPQDLVIAGVGAHADEPGATSFLLAVRNEVHKLLCTDDPRYANARVRLNDASKIAIGAIASALAGRYGIEAATVAVFAATILLLPARLSVEAWCSTFGESPFELTTSERNELSRIAEHGDAV